MIDTKLEFVFSAFPHYMKMCRQQGEMYKATAKSVQTSIAYMRTKLKKNVSVSALFNAYTEEDCARNASNRFTGMQSIIGSNLYADSGGLQMVTLGDTVNEAQRRKIYDTQIKYATHAMSFDEIPGIAIDKKRFYMPDKVYECGQISGENLLEQYNIFKDKKANTTIVPIIQGWGKKDTSLFTDGLLESVNHIWDEFDIIATGFQNNSIWGTAQRAMDCYSDNRIRPKMLNQYHMLGMSGYKRIIPMILILKSGLIKDMKTLSFDSSSISMTYVMGNVIKSTQDLKNNKKYNLGKVRTPEIEDYYKELFEFWKDAPNCVFKDWEDLLENSQWNSRGIKSAKARHDETDDIVESLKYLIQEQYFIFYNVFKYAMVIEDFLEDELELSDIFKGNDLELFTKLSKITNIDDFYDWQNYVNITQNNNVNIFDNTNNTLDCLF